jgi:hypothetical protein
MEDNLVTCLKCGGNACYETEIGELKSWMCIGCGFQTTNYMVKDSPEHLSTKETLPELYRDLEFVDLEDKVWYPVVLNFPQKGMVFAQGPSKDDWVWAGVLATEIKEEEKKKFKKPGKKKEYYTHKMDMKTLKTFPQKDFMEAADYIGLFE